MAVFVLSAAAGVGATARPAGPTAASPVADMAPLSWAATISAAPQGPSPTATALIALVLGRMGPSHIVAASLGNIPAAFRTLESGLPDPAAATASWLNVTVDAADTDAGSMLPKWEARLFAGALRDEMHADGFTPALLGDSITLQLPSGKEEVAADEAFGNIAYGQQFPTTVTPAVEATIRQRLMASGLSVASIRFETPRQDAPAVVVSTKDAVAFMKAWPDGLDGVLGQDGAWEGTYFEVDDTQGAPVMISTRSYRTGVGAGWLRPDLFPVSKAAP